MHPRRRPVRVLMVALVLAAAPLGAEEDPEDQGRYRVHQGLTGEAVLKNPSARVSLDGPIGGILSIRDEVLGADFVDPGTLSDLREDAQSLLSQLPISPPDDALTLKVLAAAGMAVTVLRIRNRHADANAVMTALRARVSSLQGGAPDVPVLGWWSQSLSRQEEALASGGNP